MEYRRACERCHAPLREESPAYVCSNGCTFCATCYRQIEFRCPNCAGELVRRPRPGALRPADGPPPPDPLISVRRGTVQDIGSTAPLFDAYRQFYEQPPDLPSSRRFLEERLARDESVLLVAERDGSVVGFVQLYPLFSSISLGRVYLLNDLFVEPRSRRHGVGRRLLEGAREWGAREGAHYLELSTAVDNPAQRLYEACGWVQDRGFLYYELPLAH